METSALRAVCPVAASFLNPLTVRILDEELAEGEESMLAAAREVAREGKAPIFLPDICALELAVARVAHAPAGFPAKASGPVLNPSLELCVLESTGCAELLRHGRSGVRNLPVTGQEMILVWQKDGCVMAEPATPDDLAALKVISEGIDPARAEAEAHAAPGLVRALVRGAMDRGLILAPPSRIRRDPAATSGGRPLPANACSAEVFTLQWHLTQTCDLSCRHCYDRSARAETPLDRAMGVIEDFRRFCDERNVRGQISLSGGNPLLYPHFGEIYRRAAGEGFSLAILGNPASRQALEEIASVARPAYYQVSLEGLPEHNDAIRGSGHFGRVMDFLDALREFDIQGQVMLTLTRDNMAQVLPLAELLEGRVWGLAFNRLSPVGRGAALALPEPGAFQDFLEAYCLAAERLGVLSFKDNLLNAHLARTGRKTFGGCTGFGCGAAFNFMALLPDGEVHACRKFPSFIGDIGNSSLGEIYDGRAAAGYRSRSLACRDCSIAAVCGGCPAVTSGLGLDIATDRDPFCPGPISPAAHSDPS